MEGFQLIGQRIAQVARLAVAAHLYESVARRTTDAEVPGAGTETMRPRITTGGAGPSAAEASVDDRLGYLVTDDEREGLIGDDEATEKSVREPSD